MGGVVVRGAEAKKINHFDVLWTGEQRIKALPAVRSGHLHMGM